MKVILLENVKRIGSIGEVIEVKRGYARNFLIANKKALYASKENISEVEKIKADLSIKDTEKKKEAAMYRRAGNLARTSLSSKGKKKEEAQTKSAKIVSAISRQKENERFSKMADEKARDNYKEDVEIEEGMKQARANVGAGKCWDGYTAKGTKKKGGKTVDNCVKAGFEPEGEEITEKKLDPVGSEDKDVDNDGDHDKSDKYLLARRKKVSKIIAMSKKK